MPDLATKRSALDKQLRSLGRTLVAYSGGVDSAFLAWSAHQLLGVDMLAVTADSPSLARAQLMGPWPASEKALARAGLRRPGEAPHLGDRDQILRLLQPDPQRHLGLAAERREFIDRDTRIGIAVGRDIDRLDPGFLAHLALDGDGERHRIAVLGDLRRLQNDLAVLRRAFRHGLSMGVP